MPEVTSDTTSTKIKAIDTEYNGYLFRSRLEARWAVFFDTIRLPYEYEKEGYFLGERCGRYLPDFWFPSLKIHCEIKPDGATINEELYRTFRDHITPILLLEGYPWEYVGTWFGWDMTDSSGGTGDFPALLLSVAVNGDKRTPHPSILIRDRRSDRTFHINDTFDNAIRTYRYNSDLELCQYNSTSLGLNFGAAIRAKQARFEYGVRV